jgi:hypothetical protein
LIDGVVVVDVAAAAIEEGWVSVRPRVWGVVRARQTLRGAACPPQALTTFQK